jgi:hypothetical protein
MKLLPKSDISFELTKKELIYIRSVPAAHYVRWLELKKTQQIIDNLLSPEKHLLIKKY